MEKGKGIRILYYEPSDELNILLGEPRESVLLEIEDEIYVRLDPQTDEVLGFTILNFEERTRGKGQVLPLYGHFTLPVEVREAVAV